MVRLIIKNVNGHYNNKSKAQLQDQADPIIIGKAQNQ
jgi:hypothetical protein